MDKLMKSCKRMKSVLTKQIMFEEAFCKLRLQQSFFLFTYDQLKFHQTQYKQISRSLKDITLNKSLNPKENYRKFSL